MRVPERVRVRVRVRLISGWQVVYDSESFPGQHPPGTEKPDAAAEKVPSLFSGWASTFDMGVSTFVD